MTLRDDYTLQPYGFLGALQFQNGKGAMPRADRRKIGAYLRERVARYADKHRLIPFAHGMCHAVQPSSGRSEEEEVIVRYLQKMIREALGPYGMFLPTAILGHSPEWKTRVAIRRAWLRHWEETGEVLNKYTWALVDVRRAKQREYRLNTPSKPKEGT